MTIIPSLPNHSENRSSIRSRFVVIAVVVAAIIAADDRSSSADTPIRLKRSQPVQRTVWSPSRVDADASAVADFEVAAPTQSQQTQSSSRRKSVASNSGSLIQQVGFLEDYGTCGPVCDCGHCDGGYIAEPACGMEYEVSCGMEPVCGAETFGGPCGCDACSGVGVGGCDGYDSACEIDCFPLFLPILRIDWNRFEFFFGSQAYHNPMNDPTTGAASQTDSGSFGFHQGFNEGRNLRPWLGADLSAQFGLRATQSNLHGEDFTGETRNQIFLTGGLFRRVDYGLQYGVVLDYLNEDWYYQADLLQLRGEVSWKMSACHNFGFHWMAGVSNETVDTNVTDDAGAAFVGSETIEASNQYRAFYRRLFGNTGEWTSYIGGTDDDHFILGSDIDVPLKSCFSMQVSSTYFSPGDEGALADHVSEGWNLGISVVYRPGANHPASRYRRPMFDVADNGSFFVFR